MPEGGTRKRGMPTKIWRKTLSEARPGRAAEVENNSNEAEEVKKDRRPVILKTLVTRFSERNRRNKV